MGDLGEEEMVDDVSIRDVMVEVIKESAVAESEGVNKVFIGSINGGDGSLKVVPPFSSIIDDISVSVLHVGNKVQPEDEYQVRNPVFLEDD